jgi:hypothetical protein
MVCKGVQSPTANRKRERKVILMIGKVKVKVGVLAFHSRRGLGIFLFTTASRTALGPTHLLSNGYQELFPWG